MDVLDHKKIGKRLENNRLKTNLSARKFAIKAKIDPSQYSKIEKGALPITENILQKICDTYHFDANSILFGNKVPHETERTGEKEKIESVHTETEMNDVTLKVLSDLAASHKNLTAAHKELAESNNALAKSQETLLAKIPTTAGSVANTPSDFSETIARIAAVLVMLGTGKRWTSEQEAKEAISNIVPLQK